MMVLQAIADGIFTGAVIALGAIGVSFTLQIMRFANFAHSEFLTWGAYLTLSIVGLVGAGVPTAGLTFGWQLLLAATLGAIGAGAIAWGLDQLVFNRLRSSGAQPLVMVFAAFGAALVMRHVIVLLWGHDSHFYTRELQMAVIVPPGIRVMPDQVFILVLAVLVMLALHLYLTYSRTGIAMRAMAESPALAQACGVRVATVVRTTWIICGGLAALAGVFCGLTPQLHPEIGFNLLLALFAAAIFGGAGSLPGAVLGGLLVGIAENLFLLVVSPGYKPAMPFILLLAVLLARPDGIFAEKR
jgi:branched-chain amino acid transport system permease protein